MPRINMNLVERVEAREVEQRKSNSTHRAIRRQRRREYQCRECHGDCQAIRRAMDAERAVATFNAMKQYLGVSRG